MGSPGGLPAARAAALALLLAVLLPMAHAQTPATGGSIDPEVLSLIQPLDPETVTPAVDVPGPARSRARSGALFAGPVVQDKDVQASSNAGFGTDRINSNMCIVANTAHACKTSGNGRFRLCLQTDANIVLFEGSTAYWASNTQAARSRPLRLCMQADNNLVAYDAAGRAFWSSGTFGWQRSAPVTLWLQNDGQAVLYDATCSAYWRAPKSPRAPAVAAPCSGGSSTDRLPVKPSVTTGPFGGGDSSSGAFDDSILAASGAQPITQVSVRTGSWIDAIRFTYGRNTARWRGGSGGVEQPALVLAADEYITQAFVRAGAYVDEIRFITNKGRYWSTSGDSSGAGDPGALASPCPAGAYRLIAVKGTGNSYLERIEFIWSAVPGAQGPAAAVANAWSCLLPGKSIAFRASSTGQPQCLSLDGRTCIEASDCWNLRMCGETLSQQAVTCSAADGAQDPTHWCSRARGALGLRNSPPAPIRAAFFNVEYCGSLAVPDGNVITNMLYNDPQGLKFYWSTISNGRAVFSEGTSAIFTVKMCPKDCSLGSLAEYVRNNEGAVLGSGRSLSQFKYQIYFAPQSQAACEKEGIGYATGDLVWLRSDFAGDINIYKHEIGHSLTLTHSSRLNPPSDKQEYGDGSTPMGYGPKCIYAAPHMLQLGWARSVPVIDWAVFSGSTDIMLRPLSSSTAYTEQNGAAVIRLASANEPTVPGGTQDLIISYKVKQGMDEGLPDQFNQATLVHGINSNTWLVAWLKMGQAYVNTANKLVVRQISGDTSSAQVRVCKYASSAAECGPVSRLGSTGVPAAVSSAGATVPADLDAFYGTQHRHQDQAAPASGSTSLAPVDAP